MAIKRTLPEWAAGCIGYTEPTTFNEFLRAMNDLRYPEHNGSMAWRDLFLALEELERYGYIDIERDGNGRIDSMILTEAGVEYVRSLHRG